MITTFLSDQPVDSYMVRSGAVAAVDTLQPLGVTHVFGNPGTTELPLIEAIVDSEISYVTCLHEDVAMGAAAGFGTRMRQLREKNDISPPLGVANVHTTPGVAHATGNLYGAMFARAPVLLTAGCQEPRHEARNPPLSGDRRSLVEQFATFVDPPTTADEIPTAIIDGAVSSWGPPQSPAYIELPMGTQEAPTNVTIPPIPGPTEEEPAAENGGAQLAETIDRPDIRVIVGDELARAGPGARRSALQLVERLDAPVFGEPLFGEAAFPTEHPHWVGMASLKVAELRETLDAETILFLGCTCVEPFLDYEPPLWAADTVAVWLGPNTVDVPSEQTFDVVATGNLEKTLDDLLGTIEPTIATDGAGPRRLQRAHRHRVRTATGSQSQAEIDAKIELVTGLSDAASRALIVEEGVTTGFLLRDFGSLSPGQFIAQNSGGLGYGLPAAVGAVIAEQTHAETPNPVVALVGDGAYQYYPQALYTAAQHVDGSLTIVVPDNAGYGILRDHGRIPESVAEEPPLTFDAGLNVSANARSYGVRAASIPDPSSAGSAIEEAMAREGTDVLVFDVSGQDG